MSYSGVNSITKGRNPLYNDLDGRFSPEEMINIAEKLPGIQGYQEARKYSNNPFEPEYIDIESSDGNIEDLEALVEEVPSEVVLEVIGERCEQNRLNEETIFLAEEDVDDVIRGIENMYEDKDESYRPERRAWSYGPEAEKKWTDIISEKIHKNPFQRGIQSIEDEDYQTIEDIRFDYQEDPNFESGDIKAPIGGVVSGMATSGMTVLIGKPELAAVGVAIMGTSCAYPFASNGFHANKEYKKGRDMAKKDIVSNIALENMREESGNLELEVTNWSPFDEDSEVERINAMLM